MTNDQKSDARPADLGPLAGLIGVWEGGAVTDVSPGLPDRMTTDTERRYRERWEMQLVSPAVENHDQMLHQLMCFTHAWRGSPATAHARDGETFHAQFSYLIWDAAAKHFLAPFAVPRGIVVNAGGTVESTATSFELIAEAGSETYGICQNPFLLENFKVVRYILELILNGDGSFAYRQDTQLQIKGRGLMHHTDANHLVRMS